MAGENDAQAGQGQEWQQAKAELTKGLLWNGTLSGVALVVAAAAMLLVLAYGASSPRPPWLANFGMGRGVRWLAALLPGFIIMNHVIYLLTSRRKQFRQALGRMADHQLSELEELYFGYTPLTLRYVIPAVLVTVLTSLAITALTNPACHLGWMYVATPSIPLTAGVCAEGEIGKAWPTAGWAGQVLRGAALGFIGGYVYMLLLLTDRARQRDVTTGIAMWAAATPVLAPVMGGVAALLIVSGTGQGQAQAQGSFTQFAVYFVAGMLPRQFALFVQSGISKMFQASSPVTLRTMPLTLIRGVGPEVQTRLEEESIFDVSALAYASPHLLMRATTYSPRQITDWIDEALLIATVPNHWEALEKVGVTGAMDLAWYDRKTDSIKALADEIKMPQPLLTDVIARLAQDAQVQDLYLLYWDHSGGVAFDAPFAPEIGPDAREQVMPELRRMAGVASATIVGNSVRFVVEPPHRDAIEMQVRARPEFQAKK